MREKVIYVDNCDIHYYVEGEGKPVILMHGWGCNATTLNSLVPTILKTGRQVINVDFPGFGKSSEPHRTWGVEEYTQAIEKLIDEEGLEKPVLLGHSFGGRIAILLATRNKVEKIVLVDAAGIKPKRKLSYYYKVGKYKFLKLLWKSFLNKEKFESLTERYRRKKGSADYAQASPRMRAILSKVVNEDLSRELYKITAPTLLIWGTRDTATPLSDAKKMNRLIKDSGIVELEGAGHYSFLDSPGKFHAALDYFLRN